MSWRRIPPARVLERGVGPPPQQRSGRPAPLRQQRRIHRPLGAPRRGLAHGPPPGDLGEPERGSFGDRVRGLSVQERAVGRGRGPLLRGSCPAKDRAIPPESFSRERPSSVKSSGTISRKRQPRHRDVPRRERAGRGPGLKRGCRFLPSQALPATRRSPRRNPASPATSVAPRERCRARPC
jgi:hypothetical protein